MDIGENSVPGDAPRASLHYGRAKAALVEIVPDDRWPRMWRLLWPGGELSDMANLSWIRDAAAAIAERGPPARNRRRFHWEGDRSDSRAEAPPTRFGNKNDTPPVPANFDDLGG